MKKVLLSVFSLLLLTGQVSYAQGSLKGTLWDGYYMGSALSLHFGSNDTIYINSQGISTYTENADTMRITDLPGGVCGTTVGEYTFTILANVLDFMAFNDGCTERALVLDSVVWNLSPQSDISELGLGLEIYPNPFNEFIRIELSMLHNESEYLLIDLAGVVQRVGMISELRNYIETSDLAKGMYLLQIPEHNWSVQLMKR